MPNIPGVIYAINKTEEIPNLIGDLPRQNQEVAHIINKNKAQTEINRRNSKPVFDTQYWQYMRDAFNSNNLNSNG